MKSTILEGKRPYFWLVLTVFSIYGSTVLCGFVSLDDDWLVWNNISFLRDPASFLNVFSQHYFANESVNGFYYRPLVTFSFMIDAWVGGGRPWTFHITNLVLHALCVCLTYRLFVTVFSISQPQLKHNLCFIAGLFFAVHPIQVMAVAWIPGRNDLLFSFFALLSFITFVESYSGRLTFRLIHLVTLFLALLTKESAVMIPVLCAFWRLLAGRPAHVSIPNLIRVQQLRQRWSWGLGVVASLPIYEWLGVGFVWVIIRILVLGNGAFAGGASGNFSNLSLIASLIIKNLGKVLFPVQLALVPTLSGTSIAFGVSALIVMILFSVLFRTKAPQIRAFGICWFLGLLLISFPYTDVHEIERFGMLEHRLYLPLAGLLLFFFSPLSKTDSFCKHRLSRIMITGALVLSLSCGAYLTCNRIPAFQNRVLFWTTAEAQSRKSDVVALNLGAILLRENRLEEGRHSIEKALRLNPNIRQGHLNLGAYFLAIKQYDKAEELFKREIELYPETLHAYAVLVFLYDSTERPQEASRWRLKAREMESNMRQHVNTLVPDHQSP